MQQLSSLLISNPEMMQQAFNGFVAQMMPILLPKMLEVFRDAVKLNTKDDVFNPLGNGET